MVSVHRSEGASADMAGARESNSFAKGVVEAKTGQGSPLHGSTNGARDKKRNQMNDGGETQ